MPRLFLDLDGVMADFDGSFKATWPDEPLYPVGTGDSISKKRMWQLIYSVPDFFATLPVMPGALDFFHEIRYLKPIILTSCPASNYEGVAQQKHYWVRKHLGDEVLVLPVYESKSKPVFLQHHGDVLIDDWGKNINAWNDAGGIGLKFEGDFESILEDLRCIHWNGEEEGLEEWFLDGIKELKRAFRL